MAHEISHYIHEIASHAPISNKKGYTPHGNISIYKLTTDFNRDNENTNDPEELHNTFISRYFASHAEVDVYATSVLLKQDYRGWDDVHKFFDSTITKGIAEGAIDGNTDFIGRKKAIQKVVNS